MANNLKEIMGIRKVEKDGKAYMLIHYIEPFSDYEAESAVSCLGMKTGNEYTRLDLDIKVGDKCSFYYEKGFGDKAVLADVVVKKPVTSK